MALIKSKQIDSIDLAKLANINAPSAKVVTDNDLLIVGDSAASFAPKKVTMANFVDAYVEAEINALKAGSVVLGPGDADFKFSANGAFNIVLEPESGKGKITVQDGNNADILLEPHGSGKVKVGAEGLASNGNIDLVLKTGNSDTGSIQIVDGANGAINLAPHGSGKVVVGAGSGNAELTSSGNHDLILKSGNATTGLIQIIDGADANINLHPDGDGSVDVGNKKITNLADPTANADAANKQYVDALVHGIRWHEPVRVATAAALPDSGAYTSANGQWNAASNGSLVIDGVSVQNGDRVLVQHGGTATKSKIILTCSAVPAAGENIQFNFADVYYQFNFVDGSESTSFGGGNGSGNGTRKTWDIKRNDGGESAGSIANSLKIAMERELNTGVAINAGAVTLEQLTASAHTAANAFTDGTSGDYAASGIVAAVVNGHGIFSVQNFGGPSATWRLERVVHAVDDIKSRAVFVMEGTGNSDSGFVQTEDFIVDQNKSAQTYAQFTGLGAVTVTGPLTKTGNTIAIGGIDALGSLTAAAADILMVQDDTDDVIKKLTLQDLSAFQTSGAEFSHSSGALSLVDRSIAAARLDDIGAGHIFVGAGGGSDTVSALPYTLVEDETASQSLGVKLSGDYSATVGANRTVKLDYVMKHVKYDCSAGGGVSTVGAGDNGTNQANTWKVSNIGSVGNKAALKAAHPMANNVLFFRNGVLDETLNGLTNKYGAAIDGDNQFTFFVDGGNLNLYIADDNSTDKTQDANWGEDDLTIIFPHMA